jgi:transcriptional regulator with XRE-family HTH domain
MIAICRRQRVKVLLAERDLRPCDAAQQLGVTPASFSQVVNGRVTAWPALRARMSELFDVPESELFDLR